MYIGQCLTTSLYGRVIRKTKIRQARRSATYQFGYLIARDYKHALELDKLNGNSRWYDATKKSWMRSMSIKSSITKGEPSTIPNQKDHKCTSRIPDNQGTPGICRSVAGGQLTQDLIHTIYSGVVSTRSLRLSIFLANLNNMKVWGADIGNVYQEASTKENYT